MLDLLTPAARNVILKAAELARRRGDGELHALHCLLAILDRPGEKLEKAFESVGVQAKDAAERIESKESHFGGAGENLLVAEEVKGIISEAKKHDEGNVKLSSLLSVIWERTYPTLKRHVPELPKDPKELINDVVDKTAESRWGEAEEPAVRPAEMRPDATPRRKILGRFDALTGVLAQFGADFSLVAEKSRETVGRDSEIEQILEVLAKKQQGNALLIGEDGVGKTAVLCGLARMLSSDEAPPSLRGTRLVALDPAVIFEAAHGRSDAGRKLQELADAAREQHVVFVLEEVNRWVGTGGAPDGFDIASAMRDVLEANAARAVATVTPQRLRADLERAPSFLAMFDPVRLIAPDPPAMATIVASWTQELSLHHGVGIPRELQAKAIRMAGEHLRTPAEPARSLELLDRACAHAALNGRPALTEADVVDAVSAWSGLPVEKLSDARSRLLGLEEALATEIMGQGEAIATVCKVLRLTKQGVDWRPERPDGVFLFTGPTGVGKTALAIALAKFLYGGAENMIRLDMSEFRESHTVSKLIGSPAGYVGYGDETMLTSHIIDRPSCLLLLDEVEKAHPDVVKLFLQVFDAGVLTDSKGRRVAFSDTTVIMTSNVMLEKRRTLGFGAPAEDQIPADDVRADLRQAFPPEFINRIDEIVVFRALEHDDFAKIVREKLLQGTAKRYAEKGWSLIWDDAVVEFLVERGSSRQFGARHIERTFQEHVLLPLAEAVLAHQGAPGVLRLGVAGDRVAIATEAGVT